MRRRLLVPLLLLTIPLAAQRVENVKAEVIGEGEKVIITYDLIGAGENQKFKVQLYGSHNNYAAPLSLVTGDVGRDRDLTPGPNKRIEWSAKSELKDFSGDVTFEVRADLVAAAFVMQNPSGGTKVKRGKTLQISWQGGTPGENVRLDLMQGGSVVSQIASTRNSQSYTWAVPKSTAKASNYQVRLSGESGSVTSGNFTVKSKSKVALIVLPIVAVGVLVAVLVSGDKPPTSNDLPVPPQYNGQ
jgi:hypothetical protein